MSANRIPIEPKKHFVFLGLVDNNKNDHVPKTLNEITCFENVFQVFPVADEKETLPDCAKLCGGQHFDAYVYFDANQVREI